MPSPPETADHGKNVRAQIIFPAIPVAYADGDAIGDGVIEFANCPKWIGGGGLITHVDLALDMVHALSLAAELWLFNSAPDDQVDNAPSTISPEMLQNHLIGVIPLGDNTYEISAGGVNPSGYGYPYAGTVVASAELSRTFRCPSGTKSLWGILVARNAFVPGPDEQLNLHVHIVQGP